MASSGESSSASLLSQLQAASAGGGGSGVVAGLLVAFAPQLLQLEQQRHNQLHTHLDQDTIALEQWVHDYAHKHETDASGVSGVSRGAAVGDEAGPALFFYLLHHGSLHLCTAFLSALYTDPASDQEFYWLNDPLSFVAQLKSKLARALQESRTIARQYALTKRIDVDAVSTQATLFSGLHEVIQTLLATRSRALTAQVNEVHALLEEVARHREAAQWQLWLAQAGAHSDLLLALDEALSASNEASWHQSIISRRALKSSSHARAFRSFLQTCQAGDRDLAALLVDEDYAEEPELFVDRLWSLASNSFQHQHHMEEHSQQQSASGEPQLSWSYPPPCVHALLGVFLLADTPAASSAPDSTFPSSSPPPSYKVWLVYYLLLDFESRSGAGAASVSQEFAHRAGLNHRQCTLIEGMLHMDAAYDQSLAGASEAPGALSIARRASFARGLACFSSDYDAVLSQADFPMVSSILASVIVLQQWHEGVTFFQNLFIANAAAAALAAAHSLEQQRLLAKSNALRKLGPAEATTTPASAAAAQVHVVFYATLHYVFYVHILLQVGLYYDAVQFIRGQRVAGEEGDCSAASVNSPLQVTLWQYWNQCLLARRQYRVLLKQVSLSEVEEEVALAYWRGRLAAPTTHAAAITATATADTTAPTLSAADLIILYHFEHHAIARGLRFHKRFEARQGKLAPSQRVQLRLPQEMLAAYAKLVHHDAVSSLEDDEDESEDEHELDLAFIQLRGLCVGLKQQQIKNAPLLARILADHTSDLDESVHMRDAQRPGSEMNPFAPANERERAAAAAAAAAARAKPAAPARPPPPTPAPAPEPKSPEKTPRVQKVSATLSAAKSRRAAQAKEREEQETKKAEEQALLEEQQATAAAAAGEAGDKVAMDEGVEEEDAAVSFPSFASPAGPRRTRSSPTPISAPSEVVRTSARKVKAVLISSTKPIAFSGLDGDLAASAASSSGAAAPFMLPVETEEEESAAPLPESKASRSKRTTRSSSVLRDVAESASASTSSSFAPVLPAAVLPDSSQFAPSLLAPSAPASSTRLKSTRKRPLLSALPSHLPLAQATPTPAVPSPSLRATRSLRGSAVADEGDSDEESSVADSEATTSSRRQPRLLATPSTRKATRRSAAVQQQQQQHEEEEEDAEMVEVASTVAPHSTRSTRRTAAPSPPPAGDGANPFQRVPSSGGGGGGGARRSRTGPLFIDESLLLQAGAGSTLSLEEVEEDETAAAPKRTRSSRVTRLDASATPSPAASANSSPARATRASSRRSAAPSPAPIPSLSMPLPVRSSRARATVDPALPAPTPRRATRQTAAAPAEAEEPTPAAGRTTRSKAK